MKASFFEPIRYVTSQKMPAQWPLAPGFYDPEVGGQLFQSIIERLALVEELGFDWVSFSEHHYGGRILTPSPILMASHIAAHLRKVKIAVLGPIMALNNPVRVAEEFAMLDNLTQGRLVVGMLRGTTNEYLVYDVQPEEAREITTEAMELVLKAWTEPQPFGWQGRHFQFRSVSVWPRPWQQPLPPTFALGTSRESCDFAARHHLGLGMSFGPVDAISRVSQYYREQCAQYHWQPTSDQIIYRGHILLAETDAEAQEALQRRQELGEVTFPMRPGVRDALGQLDSRNIAGVPRPVFRDGPLPTTFVGSPDTVVKQMQQFHDDAGVGVVDLSFQGTSADTPQDVLRAIQLFGKEVLPRLHEIGD